jgi:PIN domain nuclease of toxin-antitoxin system
VTVLDANTLIATFAGEPAANDVRPILQSGSAKIATANLVELYDRLMRLRQMPRGEVRRRLDTLRRVRRLSVVDLNEGIATRAGELRALNYDRRTRRVSLADCVATATAEDLDEPIATTDRGLAEMARDIGVEVIALPDSRGNRP